MRPKKGLGQQRLVIVSVRFFAVGQARITRHLAGPKMLDQSDARISGTDRLSMPRHYCPSGCRHQTLATTTLRQSKNPLNSDNANVHVAEARVAYTFMLDSNGTWRDGGNNAIPLRHSSELLCIKAEAKPRAHLAELSCGTVLLCRIMIDQFSD